MNFSTMVSFRKKKIRTIDERFVSPLERKKRPFFKNEQKNEPFKIRLKNLEKNIFFTEQTNFPKVFEKTIVFFTKRTIFWNTILKKR